MSTKDTNSKYALVLAAAGSGSRFGGNCAKQFQDLIDLPLYMWSIFTIGSLDTISDVIVVTSYDEVDNVSKQIESILSKNKLDKLSSKTTVIAGGASRQESVYKGLKYLAKMKPDYVLIHDAARPFVSPQSVLAVIESVAKFGAATLAVPVTDTIKHVEDGTIQKTLDRNLLYSAQTPQAARYEWLMDAHTRAQENGLEATDDAMLIELENHPVKIVEGTKSNIKITVKEDMIIGQSIAKELYGQINALLRAKNNLTS